MQKNPRESVGEYYVKEIIKTKKERLNQPTVLL